MFADILSIGDELLIGQTLNTNAHWMAQELTMLGIHIRHMLTISDEDVDIRDTVRSSMERADIVLITGGLGPTSDDITRDVLAGFFGSELQEDPAVLANIEQLFVHRGRSMTAEVRDLARVPVKAKTLYNTMGTAPGMLFHESGKVVVSMPGVPYEMKAMMEKAVIPWLKEHLELPVIVHRHILTAGKGESEIADRLRAIESELNDLGKVKLAYLPDVGKVRLRVTARGTDRGILEQRVSEVSARIAEAIGASVYGYDDDQLEASIGRDLRKRGLQLATAESCTGGLISRSIISVAGSSAYFKGAIVSYSNEAKKDLLGVSAADLEDYGAVSEPVIRQMILGAIRQLKADVAIAVSGISGPDGGTESKPVGTVYIGVGTDERQWVKRFQFTKHRDKNIEITTVVALVMLRKFITDEFDEPDKKQ